MAEIVGILSGALCVPLMVAEEVILAGTPVAAAATAAETAVIFARDTAEMESGCLDVEASGMGVPGARRAPLELEGVEVAEGAAAGR